MSKRRVHFRDRLAIRNERKWGASFRDIARRLRLPKSTVWDHAKDVRLTKLAIREETPHATRNRAGAA